MWRRRVSQVAGPVWGSSSPWSMRAGAVAVASPIAAFCYTLINGENAASEADSRSATRCSQIAGFAS